MNSLSSPSAAGPTAQLLVVEPAAKFLIHRVDSWQTAATTIVLPEASSPLARRSALSNLKRHRAQRIALLTASGQSVVPSPWQDDDPLAQRVRLARALLLQLAGSSDAELCFLAAGEASRGARQELFALLDTFAVDLGASSVRLRAVFLTKGETKRVFSTPGNQPSAAA